MSTSSRAIALALVALFCIAPVAWAQHEGHAYDKEAMEKAWMEAAQPGEPHEFLQSMTGNWKTTMTHYEMGEKVETTEGTAEFESILGGRCVKGWFTGTMMGMPHEGFSLDGYDNASDTFWSIWTDNMTTGLIVLKGHLADDGKTLVQKGTMNSPMGGEVAMRFETTRESDDHCVMKGYMTMPGMDEEVLAMEITYERMSS